MARDIDVSSFHLTVAPWKLPSALRKDDSWTKTLHDRFDHTEHPLTTTTTTTTTPFTSGTGSSTASTSAVGTSTTTTGELAHVEDVPDHRLQRLRLRVCIERRARASSTQSRQVRVGYMSTTTVVLLPLRRALQVPEAAHTLLRETDKTSGRTWETCKVQYGLIYRKQQARLLVPLLYESRLQPRNISLFFLMVSSCTRARRGGPSSGTTIDDFKNALTKGMRGIDPSR
ncbi:hypothetical protein Z517_09303 [Fonsecaea pedrosoi CBS 271.37]|uniref:Uncharacterized protein n=1 Tax=Fonsecaea pedrosoi CBS 271.37 TaxID=1442368 RepID=A0A0D2GWX4_9EURO|nr:uncharacterized protein Z517_09303 [Fonsecaea pedrosoi CBS 271.37]KIW76859.1 hypothetical protein Z517_09303 [Fonsecaea pedrosoi CBS 271.37]